MCYYAFMPSRNIIKLDIDDSYYHVYARGGNKQPIFLNDGDNNYFLHLLDRYLSKEPKSNRNKRGYPTYAQDIQLLAYCLMGNQFHLLIYQKEAGSMPKLMRSLMTSYSRYFNLKYKRSGSLFESRYKASRIDSDGYLDHISRYIHLNPKHWRGYRYSSLQYYFVGATLRPAWLRPDNIEALFGDGESNQTFMSDYEERKESLDEIKHMLADL